MPSAARRGRLVTARDVLYTAGAAGPSHARSLSQVVRTALATGTTSTAYARAPGIGAIVEAAVPLAARHRRFDADSYFSQRDVEARVHAANHRLYRLVGISALLFYAAILPLLAWAARRLPPPVDPAQRRARADLLGMLEHDELRVHYQPKSISKPACRLAWRRSLAGAPTSRHDRARVVPGARRASPELLTGVTRTTLERAVSDCAARYATAVTSRWSSTSRHRCFSAGSWSLRSMARCVATIFLRISSLWR